ncbi:hypothetical protein [Salinactinospora qingdaonensis]|uniref:Carrier domain-containing protein n=1 Tax=Salinactinospora qingdaonensis TaxID=702744 RepID=A0ABP7G0S9_9ACTN
MPETDEYLSKFSDFLRTQQMTSHLTHEEVVQAHTREELGISSLNMIMLLMNYIKEHANDSVSLKPEWVSRLNDLEGIVSVLREIDQLSLEQAST